MTSFEHIDRADGSDRQFFRAINLCSHCAFLVLVFLVLLGNPFPFSDEWDLIPYALGDYPVNLDWLWAQHVDHRIPLQKLVHVAVLRVSHYDCRTLVLIHVFFAYLVTLLLTSAVRTYRGGSRFGDMLIPLILMNPGFVVFSWGFYFQFVFSTLLVICVLSFILLNTTSRYGIGYIMASVSILLLSCCGMNAVSTGPIISLSLLVCLTLTRPIKSKFAHYFVMGLLSCGLIITLFILAKWSPSGAADLSMTASFDSSKLLSAANHLFYLLQPHTAIPPFKSWAAYYLINSFLYAGAFAIFTRRIWASWRKSKSFALGDWTLATIAVAGVAVLSSIAIGRSKGWSPGLETHYGYLATIIPLISWIAISVSTPRKCSAVVAIVLLLLYGYSFAENTTWRLLGSRYSQHRIVALYGAAASNMKIAEFVEKNISTFFFADVESTRETVKQSVVLLKRKSVEPYAQLQE